MYSMLMLQETVFILDLLLIKEVLLTIPKASKTQEHKTERLCLPFLLMHLKFYIIRLRHHLRKRDQHNHLRRMNALRLDPFMQRAQRGTPVPMTNHLFRRWEAWQRLDCRGCYGGGHHASGVSVTIELSVLTQPTQRNL